MEQREINPQFLLDIIQQEKPPPLYFTFEIDGGIVKKYNFIKWNKDIYQEKNEPPEILPGDAALHLSYKNELESQLELNQLHCLKYYGLIKAKIINWLNTIFENIYWNCLEKSKKKDLHLFVLYVRHCMHLIMAGVDTETLKIEIDNGVKGLSINNFPDNIVILNYFLSMGLLLSEISAELTVIDKLVKRSVRVYFDYIAIQSKITGLDYEKVLNDFIRDRQGSIIGSNKSLSSAEKVELVEEVRKRPGVRSYDHALQILGNEGNRPFENYRSFNAARHRLKF